jgi:hypothetical protein
MATSVLRDICFDAADPMRMARFWAEVLGYTIPPLDPHHGEDSVMIEPIERREGMALWYFNRVPEPRVAKNRVHVDITMPDDQEMERLLRLGAVPIEEMRGENGLLWWTVMADPEGNEFCAFPPE